MSKASHRSARIRFYRRRPRRTEFAAARAEEALIESEERCRSIVTAMSESIVMQERAAKIGATWELESQPGQGTSVRVNIPPAAEAQSKSPS